MSEVDGAKPKRWKFWVYPWMAFIAPIAAFPFMGWPAWGGALLGVIISPLVYDYVDGMEGEKSFQIAMTQMKSKIRRSTKPQRERQT